MPDHTLLYLSSCIYVAPTCFSAGVLLKLPCIIHALLSLICSSYRPLRASRLIEGFDILVATTDEGFALGNAMLFEDERVWNYASTATAARGSSNCAREAIPSQLQKLLDRFHLGGARGDIFFISSSFFIL